MPPTKPTLRRVGAALAAVVLVLLVVLFVHEYQITDDSRTDVGGPDTAAIAPTPGGIGAVPSGRAGADPAITIPNGPTLTLSAKAGPRLVIKPAARHRLTLTVTSHARIPGVGYLIPTSADSARGVVHDVGRSWTRTTTVTGPPNYALLFVQAGSRDAGITCTISVDGQIRSRKTTSGPYGRQVCYA